MQKNIKNKVIFWSFISFVFYFVLAFGLLPFFSESPIIKHLQSVFYIFLLVNGIYFFILNEKFVLGGLEGNLLFLDKVFFYDKKAKKQNYFFSQDNSIVVARIIIILFAFFMWLFQLMDGKTFFSAIIFTVFLSLFLKILNFFKVEKKLFIERFPKCIKKKFFYRLFLSSLLTGLIVGISSGNILKNGLNTGGTDVLFRYFSDKYKFSLSSFFLYIDGTTILLSFGIDFYRAKNKKNRFKKKLLIKYIFSIFVFTTIVLFINGLTAK
ncbi:YitT family protein ['Camptotheca acuminata' phytoplasma]|uniref:YitT family protein n=1 Tax='Camptotheca acuminata' phytoplasma TaxID=3239192 RepID=UPI00351A5F7F